MELIKRQLPPSESYTTKFIRHRGIEYAVSYNPRTGDYMYDSKEVAQRQISILQSYPSYREKYQKAVVIWDKGYDCFLIGFEF